MIHVKDEHSYFEVKNVKTGRGLQASSFQFIIDNGDILKVAKNLWLKFNKNKKCLCPFHSEAKASFTIFEGTQQYHCYWCLNHGNIIELVQEYTRKNVIESAFYIKKICNIDKKLKFVNSYEEREIIPHMDYDNFDEYLEYINQDRRS